MDDIKKILLESASKEQWKLIPIVPHHGIDIILSALHSKKSCGIGEFSDLLPVIDWCTQLKLDIIQLLPLNDTGSDPSPYNALSSCALNPIFLSLHLLPDVEKFPELEKKLNELRKLTQLQRVPYWDVQSHKIQWLREYFELTAAQLSKEPAFAEYISNHSWLKPYALFKALKTLFGQNSWITWPKEYKNLSTKDFDALVEKHWPEMSFHIALQYFCFLQFKKVKEYANSKGVLLKGDIPILISPDSADVWHYTEFFDLNEAAGAPPDTYNQDGQYWGFPLYHWEVKKRTQYSWWKQRLYYASHFYNLYRIDHVVGFFRIWAIPLNKHPKEGKFVPENEALWIPQGKELLEMMLSASPMLPIAEDLGTVPPAVRRTLMELGICGTKVMRWERYWEKDKSFIPIGDYPELSMTCVSTHDSETLQIWWQERKDEAEKFAEYKGWKYSPQLETSQRKQILWDSHHTTSLFHINLLQEYFAIFPELVWTDFQDERINVPGKVLATNWNYRFRPSIEEFTTHEALEVAMKNILFFSDPKKL